LWSNLPAPQKDQSLEIAAGQAVGIREVETGIWLVSFMAYDLGYIDLEERTLQPLENPFGAKAPPETPSSIEAPGKTEASPAGEQLAQG
jgi:hypothetical protein